MLGLVKPITVGVCGDAKPAAADMLNRLQTGNVKIAAHGNKDARLAELKKQKDAWEAELNTWGQADGAPIAPRRALRELEKAMPKNAMVTTDIGNICSVSNSYLRFEQPRSFFAAMSFGNCGYAFPTAIGAKVGAPDRPAIAYVGDGAWGMSLQETLTCVREDIPVVAVVFNNGQWGAEKKNQIDFYADRYVGTNLKNPSFAGIAKAMGAEGITVGHPERGRRRPQDCGRLQQADRPGADGHPGARRPLPPRRPQEARARPRQVQGLHRSVAGRPLPPPLHGGGVGGGGLAAQMSDRLLVLNAGSSSLKFGVYEVPAEDADVVLLCRGQIAAIGTKPRFSGRRRLRQAARWHQRPAAGHPDPCRRPHLPAGLAARERPGCRASPAPAIASSMAAPPSRTIAG